MAAVIRYHARAAQSILDADDAEIAVHAGVDGIFVSNLFVSNQGARNLSCPTRARAISIRSLRPSMAYLPLPSAWPAAFPVLVDGGIRRGTDVLKALTLGAAAVGIGRPYLYGLCVAGAEGVARVVQILRHEFELAMTLAGRPNLAAINRSVLWDWPAAPAGSSASRR